MSKSKILVVDDQPSIREFLDIMLKREDFTVKTAASGEEGLEFLEKGDFALVLCDMMMPGISGLEFLRRAKAASPATKVLIMTAYGAEGLPDEAMRGGAADFIGKPFLIEDLLQAIDRALVRKTETHGIAALESVANTVLRELWTEWNGTGKLSEGTAAKLNVKSLFSQALFRKDAAALAPSEIIELLEIVQQAGGNDFFQAITAISHRQESTRLYADRLVLYFASEALGRQPGDQHREAKKKLRDALISSLRSP